MTASWPGVANCRANRPPDARRRIGGNCRRSGAHQRLPQRAVAGPAVGVPAEDIIAVESPCYCGTMQMLRRLGLKTIEIPTDPKPGSASRPTELALDPVADRGDPRAKLQ